VLNGSGVNNDNSGALRVYSSGTILDINNNIVPATVNLTGPVTLGTSYNILTNSAPTTNVIGVGVNADATQDPGSTHESQGRFGDTLRINGVLNYGAGQNALPFPVLPPLNPAPL